MTVKLVWVGIAALGAVGCGPNVQWEPAEIPASTLVPPPPVPGEGEKTGLDTSAFFDEEEGVVDLVEGSTLPKDPQPPGEPKELAPEPPQPPAPKAPAPKAPAPKAPAPKAPEPAPKKGG